MAHNNEHEKTDITTLLLIARRTKARTSPTWENLTIAYPNIGTMLVKITKNSLRRITPL